MGDITVNHYQAPSSYSNTHSQYTNMKLVDSSSKVNPTVVINLLNCDHTYCEKLRFVWFWFLIT